MDRISGLNANQVAKELQGYKRYHGKSQKEIKEKVGNVASLRDELRRLESKSVKKSIETDKKSVKKSAEKSKKTSKKSNEKSQISNNTMIDVLSNIGYDAYINFLSEMDYIDLHNLCQTDTKASQICDDDTILKSILIKNTNDKLKFPKDLSIAEPLKKLYNSVSRLVNELYPEDETDYMYKLPRWVNVPLFKQDMMRRIYVLIINEIYNDFPEQVITNTYKLYTPEITLPFTAFNIDYEITDTGLEDNEFFKVYNNKVELAPETVYYLKTVIPLINDRNNELKMFDAIFS